jgi:hypothetical protein
MSALSAGAIVYGLAVTQKVDCAQFCEISGSTKSARVDRLLHEALSVLMVADRQR